MLHRAEIRTVDCRTSSRRLASTFQTFRTAAPISISCTPTRRGRRRRSRAASDTQSSVKNRRRVVFGNLRSVAAEEEHREKGAQKPFQRAQEEGEIVAGGGENGVDAVAAAAFAMIAAHAVLGLQVADDRLDASSRGGSDGSPAAPRPACSVP